MVRFAQLAAGALLAACLLPASEADAHRGRRLLIEVVDGRLQAQGVNTGPDDGAPSVRPYTNAIHSHWTNAESLGIATATLPGFDLSPSAATALQGDEVELALLGVTRWRPETPMPTPGTIPSFEPLAPSDIVTIHGPVGSINSTDLGSLTLIESAPFGGLADIDLLYTINGQPSGEIHVLEFVLSAIDIVGNPSVVRSSDSLYVLLSPDGASPIERLHHASLFLETYVATIPEPTAVALLAVGGALLHRRNRSRGALVPSREQTC